MTRERLRYNQWLFLGKNRLSALSPEHQKNADGSLQEINLFTVAIPLEGAETNHTACKVFVFLLLLSKAG